jgi:hypothetical protein
LADADPWDPHLEAITEKIEQMTSGRLRGRMGLAQDGGWVVEFRGAGRSVTVQLSYGLGVAMPLGDYALAVVYGCGYQPIGDEGRPAGFGKTLTYREGYSWDEQNVREVVLEAIGIVRYVFGVSDAAAMTLLDHSRQGPVAAARSTVQRRRKK